MSIVTDAWSETDPLGTDGANTIDDAMQRLERRIRERANQAGHDWNNSTLARAGRHSLGHGSVVGDSDGEFSIYDEDAVTKLFRLCNGNAAVAAGDRNAIHYNWSVIKKVLLDNFVDGANVAFALDTGVAVANASAKVFQILVNAVEKLALDKDCTFLTANVGTAGLKNNAVTPAPSTITGTSTDVAVGTSETVRLTTSYTPTASNTGVRVTVNIPYYIDGVGLSVTHWMEARLYIGGVLKAKGRITTASGANEQARIGCPMSFTWEEPAMAASPVTIEVRDIKDAAQPAATYQGLTVAPGYMTIQEFKR